MSHIGRPPGLTDREAAWLEHHSDMDADNTGSGYTDRDDLEILDYGRAAGPSDLHEVASLLRRYYTAAMARDGERGCELSYPLYAEALEENFREKTGKHDATCATALDDNFRREHAELAYEAARLRVVGLRVDGARGYALVGPRSGEAQRYLFVHRSRGAWTVEAPRPVEMG